MEFRELEHILVEVAAKVCGKPASQIAPSMSLRDDLGLDSIDMFDILANLSEKFSVSLEAEDFKGVITVADFIDTLQKLVP